MIGQEDRVHHEERAWHLARAVAALTEAVNEVILAGADPACRRWLAELADLRLEIELAAEQQERKSPG